MYHLRMIAHQLMRVLYQKFQQDFDDPENTIRIAIAIGYNKMDKRQGEFFNDSMKVMGVFKH